MKLGHDLDEIKELGYAEDGHTMVYGVTLEGRPVLRALCDVNDPERRMWITKQDGSGAQVTRFQFPLVADADVDVEGQLLGMSSRPSKDHVYAYIVSKLHILIARLLDPIHIDI